MNPALLFLVASLLLGVTACSGDRSAASKPVASPEAEQSEAPAERHEGDEAEGEAHEREEGQVTLTPEQIRDAGIEVAEVGPAQIRQRLPLYGVIVPNAERVREVAARFPGVIRGVSKHIGDAVKEGEALATIESNESLQSYSLVAPLAGIVTARNANPGEQTGDKALFTVADLSTVWVELSLFPRDIGKVRLGQTVRVKNADTKRTAEGKIVYVAPFGSSSTQTLSARVLLNNRDHQWPPGLYVTAEVILGADAAPLAVASEALQTLEERNVVFVRNEEGFEPRAVQLGRSDGEFTEVTAGLKPGETYVRKNSFILKAELGKGEAADED